MFEGDTCVQEISVDFEGLCMCLGHLPTCICPFEEWAFSLSPYSSAPLPSLPRALAQIWVPLRTKQR